MNALFAIERFLRELLGMICFVGTFLAFTIVVCELGVWLGILEKKENEK